MKKYRVVFEFAAMSDQHADMVKKSIESQVKERGFAGDVSLGVAGAPADAASDVLGSFFRQ